MTLCQRSHDYISTKSLKLYPHMHHMNHNYHNYYITSCHIPQNNLGRSNRLKVFHHQTYHCCHPRGKNALFHPRCWATKGHGWIDSIEWKVGLLEVGGDWRRWCSKRLGSTLQESNISHQSLEKENHLRKGRKRGDMLVPWGVVWKGDGGKGWQVWVCFFYVFFNDFDVVLAKPWFKIGLLPTFGFVMFLFLADWRWLNCLDEDEWRWFVFRIEGSLCFAGIDDDGVNFLSCLDSRSLVWWKDGQCYCCDVDDDGHYILAWK